jgi:two-component sensor histidine kinase
MIKKGAFVLISMFIISFAFAQNTRGTLGVTHFERTTTLDKLFKELDKSAPDTIRVNLFLQISSIYWRKERPADLDSCLFYAEKALRLSKAIPYQTGINEALFLQCRGLIKKEDLASAKRLLQFVHGEMYIRISLAIAEYYVFLPEQKKHNLDEALPFMVRARRLCDSIRSPFWRQYYLLTYSKYYFEKNEYENGKASMMEIISDYKKKGDVAGQAEYWNELAIYLPASDRAYKDKVHALEMSQMLYMQIQHGEDASYALRDLSEINMAYGRLDSARTQIIRFIALQQRLGVKLTFNSRILAAQIFSFSGNLVKGLDYLLPALQMNPSLKDKLAAQQLIGDIYFALGSYSKSIYYDQQAFSYCIETNKLSAFAFCHRIVLNLIALGKSDSALTLVKKLEQKSPVQYVNSKEYLALCYGDIFNSMGRHAAAESEYLKMIRYDQQLSTELDRRLEAIDDNIRINSGDAYLTAGNFYVGRKQFERAAPYITHALAVQSAENLKNNNIQIPLIAHQMKLEYCIYKIDSAAGRYLTAVQHLNRYHRMRDSVFSITKSTPFDELRLQYLARDKEQSIKLLKEQARRKDNDLRSLNQQRNITGAGIIVLGILTLLAYFAYKTKQNANKQLELKQKEINVQNAEISQKNIFQERLLQEKEKLIEEKELLVKEVNHRVKNNLQIMISLLNKQSSFLTNEALEAVIDSKNRMQAIATLHQKFYGETNTASVNMKEYVLDFLGYLSYSLNTGKNRIQIRQNIEIDVLNLTQAAPLGLILNEAVTNSIKHAFPGKKGGIIQIELVRIGTMIQLSIIDNGIGFSPKAELNKSGSMGMGLMSALSKQLCGTMEIENDRGLRITILFKDNTKMGLAASAQS